MSQAPPSPTPGAVANLRAHLNVAQAYFKVKSLNKLTQAATKGEHIVDCACEVEDGVNDTHVVFIRDTPTLVEGHHVGTNGGKLEPGSLVRLLDVAYVNGTE